ncbi:endonuclease/exonuclease/phosphatase family protein [Thiomicrorhabdus heinhorstiae]|nr:endonuclease/exonuclease/phosphatase family protein [Thiomicrorhabdus heinhorstiae]
MKLLHTALLSLMMAPAVYASPYFLEDFEGAATSKNFADTQFTSISITSNKDWSVSAYSGDTYGYANGYGGDVASIDWMVSDSVDLSSATEPQLTFETAKNYDGGAFQAFVSTDYAGDPQTATWSEVTPSQLSQGSYSWVKSEDIDLSGFVGSSIVIGFKYTSTGTGSGDAAAWEVDDVTVQEKERNLTLSITAPETSFVNEQLMLSPVLQNVVGDIHYTISIDSGTTETWAPDNGLTLTQTGKHQVTIFATDSISTAYTSFEIYGIDSTTQPVLDKADDSVRIATYNINLIGDDANSADLPGLLDGGQYEKAQKLAEVIQRVRPDIILLNEFDYDESHTSLQRFKEQYLAIAQANDVEMIDYPYSYTAPVNTGVPSGMDFNNNGSSSDYDDAYGYGAYPGQYGMVVLSMYPINTEELRTFQMFLWKDMPDAMLPVNEDGSSWYSDEELEIFRLSSKSHWDVPVEIDGKTLHLLASHPTPPVYDGTEDRNGTRNHDEIRFWSDYISSDSASYIYDDNGRTGGLASGDRFVVLGDQNASAVEGDATDNPISLLLDNELVQDPYPVSFGGVENTPESAYSLSHTASWAMRADYVLPSAAGMELVQSAVFWPTSDNSLSDLTAGDYPSDHRMVYVDVKTTADTESDTTTSASSGGCTLSKTNSAFDPTLIILLLLSLAYVARKTSVKN